MTLGELCAITDCKLEVIKENGELCFQATNRNRTFLKEEQTKYEVVYVGIDTDTLVVIVE